MSRQMIVLFQLLAILMRYENPDRSYYIDLILTNIPQGNQYSCATTLTLR